MDVWRTVGRLWDRALAGDAHGAAIACDALITPILPLPKRAVMLAFRSFCDLIRCEYRSGAAIAELASREAPSTGVVRFYVDAMRLLAATMEIHRSQVTVVTFELLQEQTEAVRRECGADTQIVLHPLIEAGMAAGRFADVARLVTENPPREGASSEQVETWVRLQFVRSRLFAGDLDAVGSECAELAAAGCTARYPQVGMLVEALLCYAAAQRGDRGEVEQRSTLVLIEARRAANYVQVGSGLLVAWSFSTIGQVQRAAALLLTIAGGPGLPRIKIWDRAFGYELLVTAALQRNDLAAAGTWASRSAPLAGFEVAAAAVFRARARLALAAGDLHAGMGHATASTAHDSAHGARIDELRSRMIVAEALAASGQTGAAVDNLAATVRAAERLGAAAVRHRASRELRVLTNRRGGWESLTDRERQIAGLVAEGHSNRAIAHTLFISDRTVQSHVSRTLRALGAGSRAGLPALMSATALSEPPPLTKRQQDVAHLVATGRTNAAIAEELGISAKTVEKHLAEIFERWSVSSRTAVATIQLGRR